MEMRRRRLSGRDGQGVWENPDFVRRGAAFGTVRLVLWTVFLSCIVNGCLWISFHGVPLWGLPDKDKVESVAILWGEEERVVEDREQVELAVKAAGLLNYRIFGKAEGTPAMKVIYRMKGGGEITVEANRFGVWWRGRSHGLKEEGMFVDILGGLFFEPEER